MNKTLLALLFTSTTLTFAHAGPENLVEPKVAWSKKQVSVCFADFNQYSKSQFSQSIKLTNAAFLKYSAADKATVKNAVTSTYSSVKTGIEFTGWNDCSLAPNSDAYLFQVKDAKQPFLGIASIGEAGILTYVDTHPTSKTPPKMQFVKSSALKPYVAINMGQISDGALKTDQTLALTAVHEFGHLAGLRHEHADPTMLGLDKDKKIVSSDLNCKAVGFNSQELPVFSTAKVSVYDANSVMNYCYLYVLQSVGLKFAIKWENVDKVLTLEDTSLITSAPAQEGVNYKIKIGLSRGDIHALKCLYSYTAATKKQICNANYNPRSVK